MKTFLRVMRYIRPYTGAAILSIVGLVGTTVLALIVPLIIADVIDVGITSNNGGFMVQAGLFMLLLGALRALAGFIQRFFGEWLSHKVSFDIRNQIFDKVQRLSFTYHDNAQTGNLITRAISDVDEVQRFLAFGMLDGISVAFMTIGVLVAVFLLNPTLAFYSLIPIPLIMLIALHLGRIMEERFSLVMRRLSRLGEMLEENLRGLQVVRVFAREPYEIEQFASANQEYFKARLRLIHTWTLWFPVMWFLVSVSTALVLLFGGQMTGAGLIQLGTVVAFNNYILLLAGPVQRLGFIVMLITTAVASGQRVFEILDAEAGIRDDAGAKPLPVLSGTVRFEDVSLTYADSEVLHRIDLEIKPNQVVALLGATGSGKSSIVNLIPRFYDVTSGRVLVDGFDVREVQLHSLRAQIGIVMQEPILFSATIAENIAYGRPDASAEDIIAAAKIADAHHFIQEFPEGYDTLVGERGVTLSGGQRQRVAIARAVCMNPRILILDDSTSSVDTQTEYAIQQALKTLMQGRTTLIIAQRLTSVQHADLILMLDKGHIAERGIHDELLALNGLYADMYRLQLEDQARAQRELQKLGVYSNGHSIVEQEKK